MHPEAFDWIARQAQGRRFGHVLEVGSRNWNGTIRDLVTSDTYHGIDAAPGDGVDEVADAFTYEPATRPDVVICCEVLEHLEASWMLIARMLAWLEPGGELWVTAACDPREEHDGGTSEYRNITLDDLLHSTGDIRRLEVHRDRGDIYARIVRQ